MAPTLFAIFPSVPDIAAPPIAPPNTALHDFCQSHLPWFHCVIEQMQELLLL
ncbi:hypothetical protein [Chryseobacterium sp. MYb7]|uniref:hypothetical protein n=1 Tax=Chryseobacterium sp. MYb7 TaxID=1827290 RepID=UPI0013FDC89A|nr:hypothetical protein [Chryseobacterium sp. MYb7]